ncbi:LppU/SCO3897 family protein [Micromonospora sp. NBS 11-29]|uniref:LppU/SCO3897 family protein n=1 Tax=Micromonospora sp. NBS 11-29 TaxID=1960879 RepID=UPI0020CD058A|nr:hypothetical protein [Micromonospora sp. NBS 11-29]
MTSEAPHRPGQEPGEVSPGTGGPVPYGDQPAQQDNGYNGAPDLGWAPPPPGGRPAQPAPAWAATDDQPPAWGPPPGQPVTGRATAQVPPPAEPGGRGAPPAWGTPEQNPPAWAQPGQGGPAWTPPEQSSPDRPAAPAPPAWAAAPPHHPGEAAPPARSAAPPHHPGEPARSAEQHRPAWGAGSPPAEQPAWAQPGDARGTGYVPAPATVPNETWVTPAPTATQDDDAVHSGGWAAGAAQPEEPPRSGTWTPRDEQAGGTDDPHRSGGWTPRDSQPAWVPPGQQSGATWPPAEPTARAAATASVPGAVRPEQAWSGSEQSDPDGRQSTPTRPEDDPHRSGGWNPAGAPRHDDPARSDGWAAQPAENRTGAGWDESTRDDDPDRSGGWAAGGRAAETPQPGGWGEPEQPRSAGGWPGAAAPQQREPEEQNAGWPAPQQREPEEQPGGWRGGAVAPQQREPERSADERAQPGWGSAAVPAEASARASVSVPASDRPAAWGGGQDERATNRPAVPDAEPWSPDEAWGRADAAAPAPAQGWSPAEDAPIYQPAPGPGISPGNAVPLPAQEQRVPGAALAASPPADHPAAAQFGPTDREPRAYEPERGDAGWGGARPGHDAPQSPAGPVVPGPRPSPEGGPVSASASVPVASRVAPPTDQPVHQTGAPAPQPRVYGRPARPEPEEAAGPDDAHNFARPQSHPDDARGFAGPQSRPDNARGFAGSQSRPDDAHGFAGPQSRPDDAPGSAGPQSRPDDAHGFAGPQSRPDDAPGFPRPDGPHGVPGHDGPHGFAGPQSRPEDDGPRGYPDAPPPTAAFPVGVPSFVDPPGNNRPANGVHPQDEEPRDPFDGPGGRPNPYGAAGGQQDAFHGPGGRPDPFGPGGQQDPYPAPAGGRASVPVPGQGPGGEPGGFPPAFSPPPQAPPAWAQDDPTGEPEQGRFDAFKPDAEPQTEAPVPKVRNGRVLASVLIAAVLILAVPLGLLTLLGKIGGDDKPAGFDPAVGSCIKQSGDSAVKAECGEQGAFTVVSKVDNKDKCADLTQPTVVLRGGGTNRVLCLKPAAQ